MSGLLLPWREYYRAAVGSPGPVARSEFNQFADPPTPTMIPGTNDDLSVLTFPNSGPFAYTELSVALPEDFYPSGGLGLNIFWATPATSGNVKWFAQTAYVMSIDGDQDDLDPALNTEDTVVTGAAAAANCLRKSTIAALNLTGARPGALFFLMVGRDPADGSDTLADDANLIGLELIYQRRIVLP